MKKQDQTIIYLLLAAGLGYWIYNKYYKKTAAPVVAESVVNATNQVTPAEQVAAPVETISTASYKVQYSLNGIKFGNIPSTI